MKIAYIILGAVVIYFVFYYVRFEYILSHAHLALIDQKDQKLGAGPTLRYIAAGDSTAVGEGASSKDKSYAYLLAKNLSRDYTVEYKNVAVIGAKTQDVIDKQLQEIISFNPDIVTISIGANDVTHFVNNSKIITNYKSIIQALTDKTKAKIYITNVPRFDFSYLLPWPFRLYFDSQAKAMNKEILKLGTDQVRFVDIHSVNVSNSPDQFHPSDKGYTFWTDAFWSKIKVDIK